MRFHLRSERAARDSRVRSVGEIRSSWPGWECTTDVHNANTIWRHFVEHTVLIEA